jgi:uncharacterized protein (DUF1015 family)
VATVRPFQGIRYDPQKVDLARVVAPPYDVISPRDQVRYYQQDPHNVVRLIAGEVRLSDTPQDNKYTRAAGFFREWLREGILRREPGPCIYIYRHEFIDPSTGLAHARRGILGVVQLEPFGDGVLPHERTHARAKADRLSLTRAVEANLSPVFALYDDPHSTVGPIVVAAMAGTPELSITGADGDQHTVWSLSGAQPIQEVAAVFAATRLYVADGHHRYETALNFRDKQRHEHPQAPPDAAFNYVLMLLVDVRDPGLIILPTHRVLQDLEGFDAPAFVRRLAARHQVLPRADREALLAAMRERSPSHRIGLALGGEGRGGGLPTFATVDIERRATIDPVSQLDVAVLHRDILEGELGLQELVLEQDRHVSYVRDVDAVLDRVVAGEAQAAFLVRPPAVSDVVAVARAGQVMPQKSTYFYPKPASGIVFNPLDAAIRIAPT